MARAAFAEVRLKARLAPAVTETDAAVDLVVTLAGRRLRDRAYALRLRYQPRSPAAARHSSIPATARATACGTWSPARPSAALPQNSPPCIRLPGVYSYHSALDASQRAPRRNDAAGLPARAAGGNRRVSHRSDPLTQTPATVSAPPPSCGRPRSTRCAAAPRSAPAAVVAAPSRSFTSAASSPAGR